MKGLKKPSMSTPDVKPPEFLADVYYDLRDRRLLPLVALVVVAIAVVPFLLGEDVEVSEPPAPAGGGPTAVTGDGEPTLAVVEATPGLRSYKKRLKDRSPTDPFVQRFRSLPPGAELEVTETTTIGGGGEEVTLEVEEGPEPEAVPPSGGGGGSAPGSGAGSGGPAPDDPGLRFYAFRPDIRFGVAGSGDLNRYRSLDLGQLLPTKQPVVAFMGVSEDGKRVAFNVSREVAQVRGPGRCIGGNQNCGLLILKAGQAVDLLTGRPNRDFRLAVDEIRFVEVDRPQPEKAGSSSAGAPGNLDLSQSFSK